MTCFITTQYTYFKMSISYSNLIFFRKYFFTISLTIFFTNLYGVPAVKLFKYRIEYTLEKVHQYCKLTFNCFLQNLFFHVRESVVKMEEYVYLDVTQLSANVLQALLEDIVNIYVRILQNNNINSHGCNVVTANDLQPFWKTLHTYRHVWKDHTEQRH